ncbi:hypothetical protein F5050DRAFT_1545021, partial [Lentinula boryana]
MNYLRHGNPKQVQGTWPSCSLPFRFDLKKRKVDISGDGQRRMVFTATEDAGQFVAAVTR